MREFVLVLLAASAFGCHAGAAPSAPPPADAARADAARADAGSPVDVPGPAPDVAPAPVDVAPPSARPDAAPPPSALCQVDPQRMLADVRHLASPELRGRKPGDPGNELAVAFIEEQFAAAGLTGGATAGSFRQPFAFRTGATADNVVGVREGSDPVLAKEVVIVGAHMDHLGVNRNGTINYGADDNASGTAVVIELARLYQLCNVQPKRTLLFVAWNAEEMGLLGSRAYVAKPLRPLASTKAVYIFDMVGAGDGTGALVFGGDDAPNAWITRLLRATAAAAKLPHTIEVVPQKLASDHAPFVEKGVPSVFAFARPDPHPGYHTPADDFANVRPASLVTIAALFWATLRPLALGEEDAYLTRASAGRAAVAAGGAGVGRDGHALEVIAHGCGVPAAP
jgi:hypothetical protein